MPNSNRDRTSAVKKHFNNYYDYSLLFLTIFLCCFGLVMIYSTSSFVAQRDYNDSAKFLKSQALAVILGTFAMVAASRIDYRRYTRRFKHLNINFIFLLYFICIFLQAFVLVFGKESHGKKRWIMLGPVSFQPSELTKIAVILFVAYIVQRSSRTLDTPGGFLAVFLSNILTIGLIAKANLSTAIIVCVIIFAICYTATRKPFYYVVFIILGIVVVLLYIHFGEQSYRAERIRVWKNIENEEKGYQILQGLYAIASGGLFGTGLGNSKQKLGFIPEAHNDMIFTVICEELGLFGAISVIALFVFLLYRIFVIAINAPDLFGSLICVGVIAHIAFQVILNIAVVTNAVPSTGVPLPFISYGGTSVSLLMLEIGLVLSVSNQIRHKN